jgi:ribosomal protein S18 acetylase RimI-like enzyme
MTGHLDPTRARSGWSMVPPQPQDAAVIARWSTSEHEAAAWASRPEHPFPASTVASWWEQADVQPWLLLDPDGVPAAYGELWDDEEEDEVELAHLIVDPGRRRQGLGGRLVRELLALARARGRSTCALRVAPDNAAAVALYRSEGFRDVPPDLASEWNRGQPVPYTWLVHPAP